jgi:hypothetical protein
MAPSATKIYERLCQCNEAQLAYIETVMDVQDEFVAKKVIAVRASSILKILKQRRDKGWMGQILELLDKVQSAAQDYLGGRLEHLQNFLVGSPLTENSSAESVGTIRDLRESLKKGDGKLKKPILIKVRGTLFPAALLTAGWWERRQQGTPSLKVEWRNPLQRWLFKGFDLWAPSWDVCWGALDPEHDDKHYHIAQLTEGDEADSLPVIIEPEKAKRLADEFRDSWGGFEVVISGLLGHRYQFEKKLPTNIKRDPTDYYISIEDDNKRHKISRLTATTDLYSGYLWKLLAPEEWMKGEQMLGLNQVYFVWEHTNFVAKEAVAYNLDGLAHKEALIAKQHPGSKLVLLQKSHNVVPGEPAWSVDKFYNFYLGKGKEI